MKLTKNQAQNLRTTNTGNWKQSIVNHLKENNGTNSITLYDATRPDRQDIDKGKKMHNIASQLTYLRNEGYIVIKESHNIFLLAEPDSKDKDNLNVIKGQEERVQKML